MNPIAKLPDTSSTATDAWKIILRWTRSFILQLSQREYFVNDAQAQKASRPRTRWGTVSEAELEPDAAQISTG
jgi:hypothetical protein